MIIKYPSWRYHATEKARVVQTEAESAELGPGWSDSPTPAPAPIVEAPIVKGPDLDPDIDKHPKKPGKK